MSSKTRRQLLSATTLALAAAPAMARPRAADIAQLRRQAQAWDEAIVRQDRAAIEANMAEDFRQIDADAEIETKTSFVDGLMSPKLHIQPYQVEDFEIRLYGDTALLSGRTRMQGSYDGKPFASHYRYIDVYVRRGGRWQIVSVQITRVASPAAPGAA
ncbi:nuclear transport factor 2 family protein [Paucibacter soli]|uniref:nuclear transport factor 2 family protein n=1 Tax=Paucibacter soli TaxID=3133433 RepID=UPI0030A1DC0C